MSSIPQQINSIIEARKGKLEPIRKKIETLKGLQRAIDTFERFRASAIGTVEDSASLNSVVTDDIKKKCASALATLEHLEKRFSRDNIHISFVGRAGQGKSLIMQRISGLQNDVIPSSDGSDCTGAKSIITNSDGSEVSARITFFTENEVVEIVNTYLKHIFKGQETPIHSVREIAGLAARNLPSKISIETDADAVGRMDHLEAYIQHIGEFVDKLGKTIIVPQEEIEQYVAQYSYNDKSLRYWNYLGVKEADIHTRFPFDQCGKIVLVDTIGLGATSLGVEEAMMGAVRDDSDAILYMKRPDANRGRIDENDFQIIEKIKTAVSSDYAKEMLFWIFNKVAKGTKGENEEMIPLLMEKVYARINDGQLAVAKTLSVDCSKADEVERDLLQPVLAQMADRLPVIDKLLTEKANAELNELYEGYSQMTSQILKSFKAPVSNDIRRQFEGRANKLYGEWSGAIRKLYFALKDPSQDDNMGNAEYVKCVEQTIKGVLNTPNEEEIKGMLSGYGQKGAHAVADRILDRMRVGIIDNFIMLDKPLKELVIELKRKIVSIMADAARFGGIVSASTADPNEWLSSFVKTLGDDEYFDTVRAAINELIEFDLTVKGYILFSIAKAIKTIDPNWPQDDGGADQYNVTGTGTQDFDTQAKSIKQYLNRQVERAFKAIKENTKDYLKYPNEAFFAAVKVFYDRICSSGIELNAENIDVQTAWRYYYEDHIQEVWPDESKEFFASSQIIQEWNKVSEEVKTFDKKELYTITL